MGLILESSGKKPLWVNGSQYFWSLILWRREFLSLQLEVVCKPCQHWLPTRVCSFPSVGLSCFNKWVLIMTNYLLFIGCRESSHESKKRLVCGQKIALSPLVYSWTAELSVNTDEHLPCSQSMTDVHTQFQWEVTYKLQDFYFYFLLSFTLVLGLTT